MHWEKISIKRTNQREVLIFMRAIVIVNCLTIQRNQNNKNYNIKIYLIINNGK